MIVVSMRYSPGLRKEIKLIGKLVDEVCDGKVRYHVSSRYRIRNSRTHFCELLLSKRAMYYNISLKHIVIAFLRRLLGRDNWFCVHEPGKEKKDDYEVRVRLFLHALDIVTRISLFLADKLVTFSDYGTELLLKKEYSQKKILQLSLYRESPSPFYSVNSKTILFIGQVNGTKKPKMLDYLSRVEELKGYKFRIVTSSKFAYENMNAAVEISNPENLTDSDIRKEIENSLCVLIEHPEIVQSGVYADCITYKSLVMHCGQKGVTQYKAKHTVLDISSLDVKQILSFLAPNSSQAVERSKEFEYLYENHFSRSAFRKHWHFGV